MNLVEWLKAASIEREAGLLKALSQVPLPKKVPTEGSCHASSHWLQKPELELLLLSLGIHALQEKMWVHEGRKSPVSVAECVLHIVCAWSLNTWT